MKNKIKGTFPPIYKNIQDWPIYKLHQKRDAFVDAVCEYVLEHFMKTPTSALKKLVAETIYKEKSRVKQEPWKVDPQDDSLFWNKINSQLLKIADQSNNKESKIVLEKIMSQIIRRYVEEIVGTFNDKTFKFGRRFLTFFFSRLLNTSTSGRFRRYFRPKLSLYQKLKTHGPLENIRGLFDKGTVVVVPTHFSNLDSILLGYAMDGIVGLPSFYYGAGLNLYNSGAPAYFMNRMGTYRVDRRKKNPIYLFCLKGVSNLAIQNGTNSLFFPGGTRSRSGAIENKLKLGLLGTTVEAQRFKFEANSDKKVFIVPLVMSYNFVLEARSLIEQHLKKTGKEQYLKTKDESSSFRKLTKFIWKIITESSDITLSFGEPMDVLGNPVNAEGVSLNKNGDPLDIRSYFMNKDKINRDRQRESEYTRILSEKIVESYQRNNIIMSSHLVAFLCFKIIQQHFKELDLYGVLRLPSDEFEIKKDVLVNLVAHVLPAMEINHQNKKYKLSEVLFKDVATIIADGVKNLGIFHAQKPLSFNSKGNIVTEDIKTLYYYHNRLDLYGIEKNINWKDEALIGGLKIKEI